MFSQTHQSSGAVGGMGGRVACKRGGLDVGVWAGGGLQMRRAGHQGVGRVHGLHACEDGWALGCGMRDGLVGCAGW